MKYRFSPRHSRSGFAEDIDIPEEFNNDRARYLQHSFHLSIEHGNANILIIDNLSYLNPSSTGNSKHIRQMRNFKVMCAANGLSILVITHAKSRLRARPLTLGDIAHGREIGEIADSVFALGHSTCGPDIRYLKHLKSTNTPIIHDASNVQVYQLERTEGPAGQSRVESRECRAQNSKAAPIFVRADRSEGRRGRSEAGFVSSDSRLATPDSRLVSPDSSLTTQNSQLPTGPFLGLTLVGHSEEEIHLIDYKREFEKLQLAKERREARPLTARQSLIQGLLNGSYGRYINGE